MENPLSINSPKPFAPSNIPSDIFPTSSQKYLASRLSENRYTKGADKENQPDEFKGKLLNYNEFPAHPPPRHRRRSSHQRTPSIYIAACENPIEVLSNNSRHKSISTRADSKTVSLVSQLQYLDSRVSTQNTPGYPLKHQRNISDADSVVYLGPGQDPSMQKINESLSSDDSKANTIVFCTKVSPQIKKESAIEGSRNSLRESLPILGATPVTTFCRYCKEEIHTIVELSSVKLPGKVLKILGSMFNCCSGPAWLSNLNVHKCPQCQLVLAKSRQN